jgi:hypothetical protein
MWEPAGSREHNCRRHHSSENRRVNIELWLVLKRIEMESDIIPFFTLLVLCCQAGLSVDSDIVFDLFEYGSAFKKLSSAIKFVGPSKDISEICEGESFMLLSPYVAKVLVSQ